jgi:hypothetical protein
VNFFVSSQPAGSLDLGALGAPPSAEDDISYREEQAKHEKVKREQREFKLAVERGLYVERAAVKQASATVLALLAQSLRAMPDELERELGLAPAVVQALADRVDANLQRAASMLEQFANGG